MGSFYDWSLEASTEELVAAAQADTSNNSVAMNEIVRRFDGRAVGLAAFVASDYHLRQDIANAARWGVVMAVRAHTPGTPGFASYVVRTMRGEAYRAVARNTAENEKAYADDAAVWQRQEAPEALSVVDTDLDLLTVDLSIEQRELVRERYIEQAGVGEIAAVRGTSVSAVSQRFKTIHKIVQHACAISEGASNMVMKSESTNPKE